MAKSEFDDRFEVVGFYRETLDDGRIGRLRHIAGAFFDAFADSLYFTVDPDGAAWFYSTPADDARLHMYRGFVLGYLAKKAG